MARRSKKAKTSKTRKKATTKKAPIATVPAVPAAPAAPSIPMILDLTQAPDRPTVRLVAGEYKMRLAEELTFEQFAKQTAAGRLMIERSDHVGEDGVLEELQAIVVESAQQILVDLDDEAAATITPGQYLKISDFFNELGRANIAPPSVIGSSSAPAASDSTEVSEAA